MLQSVRLQRIGHNLGTTTIMILPSSRIYLDKFVMDYINKLKIVVNSVLLFILLDLCI